MNAPGGHSLSSMTLLRFRAKHVDTPEQQQGERHAHPLVRVFAGGSDVDRKLLVAETLTD
jgi:hypothetical protein